MKKKTFLSIAKSFAFSLQKTRKRYGADFSYRRDVVRCQQCGLCQTVCPLVKASGLETFGPRAKIALLRAFLEGTLSREEFASLFSACLYCGLCGKICPAALPLPNLFAEAQAAFHLKKPTWRERIWRIFQRNPALSEYYQPLFAVLLRRWKKKRPGSSLPALPYRPFKLATVSKDLSAEAVDKRILLYTGCIARHVKPAISEAAAGIARHLGYAIFSPILPCCGRVIRSGGSSEHALYLVRKNLKILNEINFSYLLVLCPACLMEISQNWPQVEGLTKEEKTQAADLARRCVSLEEFIEKGRKELLFPKAPEGLYVHISCLTSEFTANRIKHFFPADSSYIVDKSGNCCGAFSAFTAGADSSAKEHGETVGKNLYTHIMSQHPRQIVTTCPACELQLEKTLSQNGERIPLRHTAELYFSLLEEEKNPATPEQSQSGMGSS